MPGDAMADPTIYDIARRAGVGIATVSRVLNGASGVAEATRQSVRKAVQELGFRPNRAARRLAARGPNRARVAAVMPFFSTNFYFTVCRPLAQSLSAAEMDLVLYDVENREGKLRLLERIAAERSCEGLLICSMGLGPGARRSSRSSASRWSVWTIPWPGCLPPPSTMSLAARWVRRRCSSAAAATWR